LPQDVKEGWTVAGNPAKRIPSNDNEELKPHKKNVIKQMEEMAAKKSWDEDSK
jgi:serine acetyltransferase